jgi:inorganic pyrophosphatase
LVRDGEIKNMSLKDTPLGTPQQFNVVIEIPKGTANKYEYDEEKDEIILDFVFKDGFKYLYNYGFIPQTRAGDGDMLDAIVLSSDPIDSGTVVECRPVGVIKQLDRGEQDDKIIAVPIGDAGMQKYQDIADIDENLRRQFHDSWTEIARQKNKIIKTTSFEDKDRAIEEIKKARI